MGKKYGVDYFIIINGIYNKNKIKYNKIKVKSIKFILKMESYF